MRIVIIAPLHDYRAYAQGLKTTDCLFYEGQGQYHWSSSLKELGHEILEIRNTDWFGDNIISYYCNAIKPIYSTIISLINLVRINPLSILSSIKSKRDFSTIYSFSPDVIIFSGGPWLSIYQQKYFQSLKNKITGSKIILLNGMSPIFYKLTLEKKITDCFDYIFTNDKYHAIEWKMLGAKNAMSLPVSAINPWTYQCKNYERLFDVIFVGSMYDNRHLFFEHIYNAGINIKVWGSICQHIPDNSLFWKFYQGKANSIELIDIMNKSKIAINIHEKSMQHGGNVRTFEIPACGAMQVIDRYDPSWFTAGEEIVSFSDEKDCIEKIGYYLTHDDERERIAEMGLQRVLKEHTYAKRFEKMLQIMNALPEIHKP
jgi:spore maturation protein CgeB